MTAPDELWTVPFDEQDTNIIGFASRIALDDPRCVRYIRAPESAPNGLADELESLLRDEHKARKMAAIEDSTMAIGGFAIENATVILAALRNQPGGAVPPCSPTLTQCPRCNNPNGPKLGPCELDAATKAGERG